MSRKNNPGSIEKTCFGEIGRRWGEMEKGRWGERNMGMCQNKFKGF
jgi:hypothetical protein